MPQLRVLLSFCKAADHLLENAAGAVIKGMTGNAAFPSPPVSMSDLTTARDEFRQAVAVQSQGGTLATAEKKSKRAALIRLMRLLAGYVQQVSDNHLATLVSSGFDAANNSSAQTPLEKPAIKGLLNGNSGQIIVRVGAVANARCFEGRIALVAADGTPGPWQSGGFFTNSRSMPFNGLTPGSLYEIQLRAIGGSTGISDWSDPTQHRSL